MRWVAFALAAASAAVLTACTYEVPTMSAPQLNVYSNYIKKIPGRWAMTIYVNGIDRDVHVTGFDCGANNYPLTVSSAFAQSAYLTFENVIENVQALDRPLPASALAKNRFNGIIRLKGEDVRAKLSFQRGFMTDTAQAEVELDASVDVDGSSGQIGGTRVTGHGTATNDSGVLCEGGSPALQLAAERAMRDVMGQLAERVAAMPLEPVVTAKSK